MIYRALRALVRWLLQVFYRRIEVVGLERVPARGPLIVVANHHNSLVDPMLLLAALPRRLTAVAKAPLFRHPLIGPFLWLVGALPVHRSQDASPDTVVDPARNAALFARTIDALRRGGAILIFPEGVSQPEPVLMPLRTGAARIVLGAEAAPDGERGVDAAAENAPGVVVLPVGLVYDRPGTFRAGRALVLVGDPVPTADAVSAHRRGEARAARLLTGRIGHALRALIVEAGDRHTLRLLHLAESLWRTGSDAEPDDLRARADRMQRILRGHEHLMEIAPERVNAFRAELERHAKLRARLGVADRALARPYARGAALRALLREGAGLAIALPLALWGAAQHALPYLLTQLSVAAARPEPDLLSTWKICAGVLLFPLCWIAEAWVVLRLFGAALAVVFVGALLPSGLFALAWQERSLRFRRDAAAFVRFLAKPDLHARLAARRDALLAEMRALAALVPDSALERPSR